MAPFYCGKRRRTEIENVPCHSDPASCAAYEESQGTWLFTGIETFLAILGSFESRARGSAQDDENGFVLLRQNAKDRIKMLDVRSTMCCVRQGSYYSCPT